MVKRESVADSQALVLLAKTDRAAFGEIFRRYHPRIQARAERLVRDRDLADDLAADTFLRALKGIDGFVWQGRDVAAWLNTILRNVVCDYWKSARHRRERVRDVTGPQAPPVVDESREGDPERAALSVVTGRELVVVMARLKPAQRQCVSLRFLERMSISQTARAMGRPVSAVKALQMRALANLRALLTDPPKGGSGG